MKKVVFVYPPSLDMVYGKLGKYIPPTSPGLGLLYVAGVLEREGYSVEVVDAYANNLSTEETVAAIKRAKPDIIGVTTVTIMFSTVLRLARTIKQVLGDIPIVAGGPHVSGDYMRTARDHHDCIDICVMGEGEQTFLEIVRGMPLPDILGIAYFQDGQVKVNPPRPFIDDLDSIPFPSRHLIDLRKYSHALYEAYGKPMTTVLSSRGCPYNCTFCAVKTTFGRKVRYRKAEGVVEEIDLLIKEYGIRSIEFRDDTFALNPKHVLSISKLLEPRRINWIGNSAILSLREDMVRAMKRAGCTLLQIGVESGNQEILDEMKKGTTLEKIEEGFRLLNRVGIDTMSFFIFGYSKETPETARQTIEFAKRLDPMFAEFFLLHPFPGTEAYDDLVAREILPQMDYAEMSTPTFFNPVLDHPNLTKGQLRELIKTAYKEFYFRRHYFWKVITRMNSWLKFKYYVKLFPAILKLSGLDLSWGQKRRVQDVLPQAHLKSTSM